MYVVLGFIGLLIWAAILQAIISSSTRTNDRIAIAKQQSKLLTAIAIKLGVTDEEVKEILTPKSKLKGRFW